MTPERLAIAQVTPFAWEATNEVNEYVGRVAGELSRRGHRVVIIAPSNSSALVRDSRRAIRAAREQPELLLERAEGEPLVLGVGEVLPFSATRRRASSLPMDVARTIEDALTALPLDVVHVHEPFAPSAASVALRNSRALNVGSFHAPTERILSTQLARPLVELLFSRLDARTASFTATRDLVQRYFPGDYRVIMPGADPAERRAQGGPVEIVMVAEEERAALRVFLRALRALPSEPEWRASVWSSRTLAAPATLRRDLAERVRFIGSERTEKQVLADADIVVLASEGIRPTPGTLVRALAAGAVPVTSRLASYDELLCEGEYGLEFEPGDAETLGAHLTGLIADPELREGRRARADPLRARLSWGRVTDELEGIYTFLAARRHVDAVRAPVRKRVASRPFIDVDLHMHTDHSYDCATPVEVLLAHARLRGLGAIAVTDHNEVSGAHEARAKSGGVKVIVAEEIKTADQGEVIGLFIEDKIARGMTLQETIAEIKRQGGLVYVPHPFDRLHSVPDYEHLLDVLDDVDAIEVFNPRVAIAEFNEEAVRFAAKYRIPAGAGSDAHVPQGLGSVRIRMRDFDGPEEFMAALRDADIVRNPASLLYVQALKFLQTRALPAPARRASRERRVRRATRKP
ncbi:MAG TPA: PHP-associated domain-containing protein [Solirubrobacteraceae bacterium]|nr:PHP-associated domain-containing protein [Solirubrobacteraceae bacterium]